MLNHYEHCMFLLIQNIRDWVMALGVLVLVVIDLILLILYISINYHLGYDVVLIPNRDRPRSVSGVSRSILIKLHGGNSCYTCTVLAMLSLTSVFYPS